MPTCVKNFITLASEVPEIWVSPPKFICFTWPDHAPFRDDLCPRARTCYNQPAYQIWRLSPPTM